MKITYKFLTSNSGLEVDELEPWVRHRANMESVQLILDNSPGGEDELVITARLADE